MPGAVQVLLPLRSPPSSCWYSGVEAISVEAALRGARAGSRPAAAQLAALTRPEVQAAAKALWRPGCALSVEELVAEGEARLVTTRAWERFEPGRARGRTLWPSYARRIARQGMVSALQAAGPVHITQWARRVRRAAAEASATEEAFTYRTRGARGRMVTRRGVRRVAAESEPLDVRAAPLTEVEHLPAPVEQTGDQLRAMVELAALPVRQRIAVAGPLGLLREGRLGDRQLAARLRCTPQEVEALREAGLARLRSAMEE